MAYGRDIGLLKDPTDNNVLLQGMGGLGATLTSLSRDPSADPVAVGSQAMAQIQERQKQQAQEYQKQQVLKNLQENVSNLPPMQRAAALAVIQSGDAGAINTLMKNLTSPISVAKGGALIDPMSLKTIYQAPSEPKTTVAITNADALGLTGQARSDYIREATVGKSSSVFQKNEMAFAQQVAQDNNLEGDKLAEAIDVIKSGGNQLSDGTSLRFSQTAREKLDAINKARTTGAILTQGINAKQAESELGVLSKYANDAFNQKISGRAFGDIFMNRSPAAVVASFSNNEEDQKRLGRFVAAQGLQYEIAQQRNKLAGGQPGVASTDVLMQESGQHIARSYPMLSNIARQEASDYLNKALEEGLGSRRKAGAGASIAFMDNPGSSSPDGVTPAGMVNILNTDTGAQETVSVAEARKRGVPGV